MINPNVVVICEILGRTIQGVTKPFRCRGEDGSIYFVKGKHASRRSQISEWVGGNLAKSFGLPVPRSAIVEIPEGLSRFLPDEWGEIGDGLAFGSLGVEGTVELTWSMVRRVPIELQQKILLFDWWVRNGDRTLTELGGNPNLLWRAAAEELVVIDHNQAFDDGFCSRDFLSTHVFREMWPQVSGDAATRKRWEQCCENAIAMLDVALDSMPDEWWYVGEDAPHQFTQQRIIDSLESYASSTFWEFEK